MCFINGRRKLINFKFWNMPVCSEKCKKWTVFGTGIFAVTLGLILVLVWAVIFQAILNSELSVSSAGSTGFNFWKETPIPMYIRFYLFNWTNSNETINSKWAIKPEFVECGPYTFSEHHVRVNVEWHDNGTLSYQQKRIWHFLPEQSGGDLTDVIVNLNVVAATIAYVVRDKAFLIQRAVSFLLEEKDRELAVAHTVDELLFEGYEDDLLALAHKLNISGLDIPFDKFGWFYSRNESETFDGNFTMFTGGTDIHQLGVIELWNGEHRTKYYPSYCGDVNGTSGELWPPNHYDVADVFSPDLCSTINLPYNGTVELYGIVGNEYVGDISTLDNGSLYPEKGCFNAGVGVPSGTRNVSQCRYGAPAFVSFPHFYLADPSYREGVVGMNPNRTKHQFSVSLEPNTGIPLNVRAQVQINIMIQPLDGITMFKDVKQTFVPMLWFSQTAELTPKYADLTKMLLTLPSVGRYTGYGVLALGVLTLVIWIFISVYRGWNQQDSLLLSQQSL